MSSNIFSKRMRPTQLKAISQLDIDIEGILIILS